MKDQLFSVLSTIALLMVIFMFALPVMAADPPPFPRNNMVPMGLEAIDGTYLLGEKETAFRKLAADIGAGAATNASPVGQAAEIGEEIVINVSDMGKNIEYSETFVVLLEGVHGIILVEKAAYDNYDPDTNEYIFPNPIECEAEPPPPWVRTEDRISTAQLQYLLDQFDTVIYPTDTSIFGEPLPRGAEGQKTWILIHNIRDESYYDCEVNMYIAGYFAASEDAENNKNMMHIDTYDWVNRVGPDGLNPYLYEIVFAHEFQHLVHFDQDPDETEFVNEGLADLAGFLCGYGHSSRHIMYYMMEHHITSLTFWDNTLADYGAAYLFALYLYEHFGGVPFISALVQEQANGIEGIENTLAAFGYGETFNEVFDNWTIANYMDDTRREGGKYGYESLDVGTIDTYGYTIEYALQFWSDYYGQGWGEPVNAPFSVSSNWFFGEEPRPYTAHYFRFTTDKIMNAAIDGDDFSGTLAYSGSYEWYSGAKNWAWRSFHQTFVIPESGATLNFQTFYEIEPDWDYGYVEVYDQDTDEWYTLEAPGITTSTLPFKQDNPDVPAGREPKDYKAVGRWHAFTGFSGGWIPVSMDLSPFAGHTIDIHFRTWQDLAFTYQMMYIDDISIPEIAFFDDVEAGENGWIADDWYRTDGKFGNGLHVTTIDTKWVGAIGIYPEPAGDQAMELYNISHMTIDQDTQSGTDRLQATSPKSNRILVSIVSNRTDHILFSHYEFGVNEVVPSKPKPPKNVMVAYSYPLLFAESGGSSFYESVNGIVPSLVNYLINPLTFISFPVDQQLTWNLLSLSNLGTGTIQTYVQNDSGLILPLYVCSEPMAFFNPILYHQYY